MKKFNNKERLNMKKVFLGGTCNESTWRGTLKSILNIDYFDPVVDDWTEDCMKEELKQRKECDFCLYVITPDMTGCYSIAEVIDDSNKRPKNTIFCFIDIGNKSIFDKAQIRSLNAVGKMVQRNGGFYFQDLTQVANFLNGYEK